MLKMIDPSTLSALPSPASLGDGVPAPPWASVSPSASWGGGLNGLRVPWELCHSHPYLADALLLPSTRHLLGALPLSPGPSSTPTSGQSPYKSRLPLLPRHLPTRPPQKAAMWTESKDVLIYSIKSPCGQRLVKVSALQNFSFNRIS